MTILLKCQCKVKKINNLAQRKENNKLFIWMKKWICRTSQLEDRDLIMFSETYFNSMTTISHGIRSMYMICIEIDHVLLSIYAP
jgi:hypothetical protein